MDSEVNKSQEKQPYERPRLSTINLRPEEAVLGHCKTASGGGIQVGCQFFTCSSVGS
jgi:hypothetical protein